MDKKTKDLQIETMEIGDLKILKSIELMKKMTKDIIIGIILGMQIKITEGLTS